MSMQWYEARFDEDPRKRRFDCQHCGRPMWFPASKAGQFKTCGNDCAPPAAPAQTDSTGEA
jgi:hypothetical protein